MTLPQLNAPQQPSPAAGEGSKRRANNQGGAERYGGRDEEENERDAIDPVVLASAEVMAHRKIAPLRKRREAPAANAFAFAPPVAPAPGLAANPFAVPSPASVSVPASAIVRETPAKPSVLEDVEGGAKEGAADGGQTGAQGVADVQEPVAQPNGETTSEPQEDPEAQAKKATVVAASEETASEVTEQPIAEQESKDQEPIPRNSTEPAKAEDGSVDVKSAESTVPTGDEETSDSNLDDEKKATAAEPATLSSKSADAA